MTPDHKAAMQYAKDIRLIGIPTVTNLAACYLDLVAKARESLDANAEYEYRQGSVPHDRNNAAFTSLEADAALREILNQGETK